jgi:hypothetical protein
MNSTLNPQPFDSVKTKSVIGNKMNFYDNLVKARSYIVVIVGLLVAFSGVLWVEFRSGWGIGSSAPQLRMSENLSPVRVPRKLTAQEVQWAQVAWKYFENNVNPVTGLASSVEKFPSTTMWDTGSYLMAILSAKKIGLIEQKEFDNRIELALSSIARLPLFDKSLPNKAYDTNTLVMTDYANKPSQRGIGWSAVDLGRLLVPLNVLVWQHSQHADSVRKVLAAWNVGKLSKNGQLYGARVSSAGETQWVQEGRLGYEQYAAKSLGLMGLDVTIAGNYTQEAAYVDIHGINVAYDRRIPRLFGAQNFVVSEPYVLDGLEYGWDSQSRELSWRVYSAQQRNFENTGKLTAVTEDHLDQSPYFVYNTIYNDGKKWSSVTESGEDASKFRNLSVKASFGWYALHDSAYSKKLIDAVSVLNDPERGWYSGLYEESNKPNKAMSLNTNAVVLESLAYVLEGQFIRYK